jgi:hypothetical protein
VTQDERFTRLEKSMYGNGKRGVLERIGRIEIVAFIILGFQISILVKLFLGS